MVKYLWLLILALASMTLLSACGQFPSEKTTNQKPEAYYIFSENDAIRVTSGTLMLDDGTVSPDGRVWLIDKRANETRLLTSQELFGEHFYAAGGAVSSDGTKVYVTVNVANNFGIYEINIANGEAREVASDRTMLNGALMGILGESLVISPDGTRLAFRAERTSAYELTPELLKRGLEHSLLRIEIDIYTLDLTVGLTPQLLGASLQQVTQDGHGLSLFPHFTIDNNLTLSEERSYQLSEEALNLLQTTPTMRLPYTGRSELTTSWHGTNGGRALDFAPRPWGTTMLARAAVSGTVEAVGLDGTLTSGCGYTVRVYHPSIGAAARYCHLVNGSSNLQVGQAVSEGTALGTIGNTGTSTGVHLHFHPAVSSAYGLRGTDCTTGLSPIYANDWQVGRQYASSSSACN
jgi:murein DD-endopeptidase MepM/ murein hydrolase activator NlpD